VSYSSGSCLPAEVGSGAATCSAALEPASLVKRAPAPPCVPWVRTYWEGSSAQCVMCLRILPPCGEGFGPPRILRPPCGSRASSTKKSPAGLLVRQGSPIPNARAHIFMVLDVRAIMGLQDVRAGIAASACKTCRHAATVQRQRC
jgi:hypothetical protein